jgi:hypothetical protein
MRFRTWLSSAFDKWLSGSSKAHRQRPTLSSPAYVVQGGDVARFIFQSDDIFAGGTRLGCPKPKAFGPDFHPDLKRYELSVCGLNSVSEDRVWALGRTIRARENKTALATIFLPSARVTSVGLHTEPAPEQPHFPEHGVILGWSQLPEAKSERLQVQTDLAALCSASDVKRPPSTK